MTAAGIGTSRRSGNRKDTENDQDIAESSEMHDETIQVVLEYGLLGILKASDGWQVVGGRERELEGGSETAGSLGFKRKTYQRPQSTRTQSSPNPKFDFSAVTRRCGHSLFLDLTAALSSVRLKMFGEIPRFPVSW